MEANRILMEKKYVRIIQLLAERKGISIEAALKIFYESSVYQMISAGIADMHCRSVYYIVDEILIEIETELERKKGFLNRITAYQNALYKINTDRNPKEE